jgi:H+/Cl- antiporter ClcA
MGCIRVKIRAITFFTISSVSRFCFLLFLFLTDFIFSGQEDYSFAELLPMAIIGVIGGLLGSNSVFYLTLSLCHGF